MAGWLRTLEFMSISFMCFQVSSLICTAEGITIRNSRLICAPNTAKYLKTSSVISHRLKYMLYKYMLNIECIMFSTQTYLTALKWTNKLVIQVIDDLDYHLTTFFLIHPSKTCQRINNVPSRKSTKENPSGEWNNEHIKTDSHTTFQPDRR